ncbi:MAG: hypothetical protein WBO34_06980 [Gammaproteobacteria bacterium]
MINTFSKGLTGALVLALSLGSSLAVAKKGGHTLTLMQLGDVHGHMHEHT